MAESDKDDERDDIARFSYPRNSIKGRRTLIITYRGVRMTFHFPTTAKGEADLDRLINTLPEIMVAARQDMTVTEEMASFDAEAEKFWTDEDER